MNSPDEDSGVVVSSGDESRIRVVRSKVPAGLEYPQYLKTLRWDFIYACAYCTLAESEATSISFATDHYEPRSKRPDLEHTYDNLMYACNPCNVRKGSRSPSDAQRQLGYRFFRADADIWDEHFKESGIRIQGTSNTGRYTELFLDLNRKSLRKLREIRNRAVDAVERALQGVSSLRQFPLDDLPGDTRLQALRLIRNAADTRIKLQGNLDDLLREYARSRLEDGDEPTEEDIKENKDRRRRMKEMGTLLAGQWTGRKPKRQK